MAHDKQAKQVLEADMGARALMEQEQSMRRLATVVLEGPVLHMGDFVVRLALPAQRPGAEQLGRFLLVTVEYLPLLSWHAAQPVLEVRVAFSPRACSAAMPVPAHACASQVRSACGLALQHLLWLRGVCRHGC